MNQLVVSLVFALVLSAVFFAVRQRGQGSLLLDVGGVRTYTPGKGSTYVVSVFAFGMLILMGYQQAGTSGAIVMGVFVVGLTVAASMWRARAHLRFMEGGIAYFGLTRWREVRSYEWLGPYDGCEFLGIGSKIFGRSSGVVYMIPLEHRAQVEQILAAHVKLERTDTNVAQT
ncbi:MAG TPA: hypothetical protein VI504_00065 [Candidatus Eisenbacteria bacterium]